MSSNPEKAPEDPEKPHGHNEPHKHQGQGESHKEHDSHAPKSAPHESEQAHPLRARKSSQSHEAKHGEHRAEHSPSPRPHPGHDDKGRPFYRQRHFWIVWVPVIVVLLLIGGCVFSELHKKAKKPPADAGVPVSVTPVRTGSIDVILDSLGIVTPVSTVSVTSRVTGELTEVDYKEGHDVKKNDPLLLIDPRPYEAAEVQAAGQLARDQALLENAWTDLKRYEDAVKTHAIPEQQVATQRALVKEDEGIVQLDEGNHDAAKLNVDYTQIRSPIDGRVGLRQLDLGNIVPANGTTPLVTVTQLQPITIIFTLAEDYLGEVTPEIKPDQPLRVDAYDRAQQKKIAQGTLDTLDNEVNTSTGTVKARATFANANYELFPNQFVNVKLYVKTLTNVDLVPTAAIQHNDTAAFVYVVQPAGTVKSTPVGVTVTEGDMAAVTGVKEGDSLVTDGFEKLQDGSKVTVKKPGDKADADQAAPKAGKAAADAEKNDGA